MSRTHRRYLKLQSGHWLAMYTTRRRLPSGNYGWIVDVCIKETKGQCDYWHRYQNQLPATQTNTGGLEGLVNVFRWIKELEQQIREGDIILVYWIDEKRRRAFKYLERLGFIEGSYFGKSCYHLIKKAKKD